MLFFTTGILSIGLFSKEPLEKSPGGHISDLCSQSVVYQTKQ